MAGINDTTKDRIRSMWIEAGIQFRSNLVLDKESIIELHVHSYDHISMVMYGWFLVKEITKEGIQKEYQVASRGYIPENKIIPFQPVGYRFVIPSDHQHTFSLIETTEEPSEILCFWVSDGKEDHQGC